MILLTILAVFTHILSIRWASLVAQMVKNPVAVRETWVQSLGWKDSFLLHYAMVTHPLTKLMMAESLEAVDQM